MATVTPFSNILPKNSKLDQLLALCNQGHELHLHELSDGALTMICFTCPFHVVLSPDEEEIVRAQMSTQGVIK